MCFDKCTHPCAHFPNEIQNISNTPKSSSPFVISSPHPHCQINTDLTLITLSVSPILELYVNGITSTFCGCLLCSVCFVIYIIAITISFLFVALSSIPSHEHATICLSINLLIYIWLISSFWIYQKKKKLF